MLQGRKGWVSASKNDYYKVRELNDKLMMAERAFTDKEGLSGRPWYKHLVSFSKPHASDFIGATSVTSLLLHLDEYSYFSFIREHTHESLQWTRIST